MKSTRENVPQQTPIISAWSCDKLQEREKEEVYIGGFGKLELCDHSKVGILNDDDIPIQELLLRKKKQSSTNGETCTTRKGKEKCHEGIAAIETSIKTGSSTDNKLIPEKATDLRVTNYTPCNEKALDHDPS